MKDIDWFSLEARSWRRLFAYLSPQQVTTFLREGYISVTCPAGYFRVTGFSYSYNIVRLDTDGVIRGRFCLTLPNTSGLLTTPDYLLIQAMTMTVDSENAMITANSSVGYIGHSWESYAAAYRDGWDYLKREDRTLAAVTREMGIRVL